MTIVRPQLIHVRQFARNGFYPATGFYRAVVDAENHLVASRKKQIFKWHGALGVSGGGEFPEPLADSGSIRFHCHTGYGTTKLVAYAILGPAHPDVASTDTPYVGVSVTVPGGATTTLAPLMHGSGYGDSTAVGDADFDAPNRWSYHRCEAEVSANQTYEGLVTVAEHARLLSLVVFEEATGNIDESVSYYNAQNPQAGSRIYDNHRQRLVQGMSNMWQRNGALAIHWSAENGTPRTRTSATAINLIDNATTGTPSANAAGWKLDLAYRTTSSRAVVPVRLAVYASQSSGSGTVRLIDTDGATLGSITINSSTPQWWTTTANLVASAGKFYAPQFASNGTNTLSVYALSLYEYEA